MLADSNILVYSINRSSPKQRKAQEFLQENRGNLEIAHQNIFEALRVLTHQKFPHPLTTTEALKAIEVILKVCRVISPNYRTHFVALELIKKYKLLSDQIFDAYLVATAITNGVYEIATDNERDFQKFKEIKIINPFKKFLS